jgi:hypothetical protein
MFSRTFKLEQRVYEPHGIVIYVRDRYGLRGSERDIDTIELATVGGSTTDQRLISEGETWQDVIRLLSGIHITNAGDDGLSSSGHVVALIEWLHRLPALHPRFYLHYIGINDALFARCYTPNSKHECEAAIAMQSTNWEFGRFIRGRSVLYEGLIVLRSWLSGAPDLFNGHQWVDLQASEIRAKFDEQPIMDYIRKIYEPNLRRLIAEHQTRNEQPIFVSQTIRPSLFRREGGTVLVRDRDVGVFLVALGLVNAATHAICEQNEPNCHFIDLASEVSFRDDEFYDDVHTTPAGARRIGTYLAEKLYPIVRRESAASRTPSTSSDRTSVRFAN